MKFIVLLSLVLSSFAFSNVSSKGNYLAGNLDLAPKGAKAGNNFELSLDMARLLDKESLLGTFSMKLSRNYNLGLLFGYEDLIDGYTAGIQGDYLFNGSFNNSVYFSHAAFRDFRRGGFGWKLSTGYAAYWSTLQARMGVTAEDIIEGGRSGNVALEMKLGFTF